MTCAVLLAAGLGTRLRPLTAAVPKPLCPVGNVALLDLAMARLAGLGLTGPAAVAVNASHLAGQVVSHVGGRATVSVEEPGPLGTAGALGRLREWIGGRGVLVGNADAYLTAELAPGPDIAALVDGWAGRTVRLLVRPAPAGTRGEFGRWRFAGFSLLPWSRVAALPAAPEELWRAVWRPAEAAGELECVPYPGSYLDCGTPADYLAANLLAAACAGGSIVAPDAVVTGHVTQSVIGAGAAVRGTVTRAVVWAAAAVDPAEDLTDAIRLPDGTTVSAAR